jgi:hypothetical protein
MNGNDYISHYFVVPLICAVNVMRAIVLNATNMGVYDIAKGRVVDKTGWSRKDPRTVFCSSFLAGFFMTITVVRTAKHSNDKDAVLMRRAKFLIFIA